LAKIVLVRPTCPRPKGVTSRG